MLFSHKLPGTASCSDSSEDLFEEPGKQNCSGPDRQSDSHGIYKQPGQDNLHPDNDTSKEPMDVEPRERIMLQAHYLPWVENLRAD